MPEACVEKLARPPQQDAGRLHQLRPGSRFQRTARRCQGQGDIVRAVRQRLQVVTQLVAQGTSLGFRQAVGQRRGGEGRPGAEVLDDADAGHMVLAEAGQDAIPQGTPVLAREVEVDVRQILAALMEKAFDTQPVRQRVQVGNTEQVAN